MVLAQGGFVGGPDRLLRVTEVAQALRLSTATVYRLCHEGALPHVRIANAVRVRVGDLDAFVAGHRN